MSECPSTIQPEQDCLLIVDGHAYAHRAYHAIASLHAPDGTPTNAVFGFTKAIDKLLQQFRPTHVVVIWDGGLDAGRLEMLPAYKGDRPSMPNDLRVQFDPINAWLDASGIKWVRQDGVEADDWIAVLAKAASLKSLRVIIASSDKDFMQLVSPCVNLVNPSDKNLGLWGETQVVEKSGVKPAQIVDWLSLMGDNVDNIEGVPGVGPKTAAELMNQFGSIDVLYQRLPEVTRPALRSALGVAESTVRRNQELIRLKDNLALDLSMDSCRRQPVNADRVQELCNRWGFRNGASAAGRGVLRQKSPEKKESELLQGELL